MEFAVKERRSTENSGSEQKASTIKIKLADTIVTLPGAASDTSGSIVAVCCS
jgi:hypothetical protein